MELIDGSRRTSQGCDGAVQGREVNIAFASMNVEDAEGSVAGRRDRAVLNIDDSFAVTTAFPPSLIHI